VNRARSNSFGNGDEPPPSGEAVGTGDNRRRNWEVPMRRHLKYVLSSFAATLFSLSQS